jgi:hypothetical protein
MQSLAHRRLSNLQEAHGEFPPILVSKVYVVKGLQGENMLSYEGDLSRTQLGENET